jgi:hypothetical protein
MQFGHKLGFNCVEHAEIRKYSNFAQYILKGFFSSISWCGVRLSPTDTSTTIWPTVPAAGDIHIMMWSKR